MKLNESINSGKVKLSIEESKDSNYQTEVLQLRNTMGKIQQEFLKTHSKDLIDLIDETDLMQVPDASKVNMIKDLQDLSLGDKLVEQEDHADK
jgi:hypothetical protein